MRSSRATHASPCLSVNLVPIQLGMTPGFRCRRVWKDQVEVKGGGLCYWHLADIGAHAEHVRS
jgi:hypothetical protein